MTTSFTNSESRGRAGRWSAWGLLAVIAVVDLAPLIYMAALSGKGPASADGSDAPRWFGPWIRLAASAPLFGRWFLNSAGVAVISVVYHLVADSMAAYVLAKRRFRGRGLVFALILVAMMIPRQVTLIPLFLGMGRLGLSDTFAALVLPGLGDVIGVFLLRQFMISLPDSLIEAARIDGASQWVIYTRIIAPLSWPALATLATLAFQHYWSDFFWPLVITQSESQFTLQVGLAYLATSEFGPDLPLMAAGACSAALPAIALFMFFRGAFFEGLRAGAVK